MFTKKTKEITIEGQSLTIIELSKKQAFTIKQIADEGKQVNETYKAIVRKADGSAFFSSDSEIDELPTSVVNRIGEAFRELNEPKN